MNYIAYWSLLLIIVSSSLFFVMKTKRFTIKTYIVALSVFAGTEFIDVLFSERLNLYYYLDVNNNVLYALLYDLLVYPAFAIVFEILAPKKWSLWSACKYIIIWTIGLTALDVGVIYYFKICVYTKWKLIPHSPLFYFAGLTLTYMFMLVLDKVLKREHAKV